MPGLAALYQMPGHLIRRAQQMAVAVFHEECVDSGLTPVQYAALVAIGERGPLDATRLAALISFDRSTIGSVLDRLETKALIDRMPDPHDRRLKLLRLTADGKDLVRGVRAAVLKAQIRIMGRLDADEQATLIKLLQKLIT